jgi:lipoic acid synthetase/lipoyl(octanoyl) transferase
LQAARRSAVEEGIGNNALLLLEHEPTVTLGRNAHGENLLATPAQFKALGIEVCETARGGDVTYHGPGQLVAYPILNLAEFKKSVRWYLRALEDVIIDTLTAFGVHGEPEEGLTGVWVNGAKVAAIGVTIRKWVTSDGVALNIDPPMDHFKTIIPCGIADRPVTSLKELLGKAPEFEEVSRRFEGCFLERFLAPLT